METKQLKVYDMFCTGHWVDEDRIEDTIEDRMEDIIEDRIETEKKMG